MVEQRMRGKDDVGVVLFHQVDDDVAHAPSERRTDGRKRGLVVARVIDRAPCDPRALNDGRVQRRQPAYHRRPLRDERVGDGDLAGRVELFECVGQRSCRRAMAAARIAEEDQNPGRAALRRWTRGCRAETGVRLLGAYLRRAAARRAIQRMLYWARRNVTKTIAPMPMKTQRIVRLASSPG